MSDVKSYRDLMVWQKAMQLAEDVFRITENFPSGQRYVLVSQMQRSALSVPSNIAEGRSRHSENDFIYHINIARGSLAELETQAMLSHRLGFMDEFTQERLLAMASEIRRMLFGLRTALKPETSNLKLVS